MEQTKSNTILVVLAIIITAVLVGGGVYMWQNKEDQLLSVLPSPKTCVDEPEGTPVITSLSVSSGSSETDFEIKGCNFASLDGLFNAWIENSQGVKGRLVVDGGTANLLNVALSSPLCKAEWVVKGGSGCDPSFILTPGAYKIGVTYVGEKIGDTYRTKKSNEVPLTINPMYNLGSYENNFINVTGEFSYYLQSDNSFAPYKKSALNRICFEPAQLETINDGAIFCFTNTQEALSLFGFKVIDNDCKYYWGTATIKIKNLTDKNLSNAKSDPCVESGTCQFNEAELIEASEMNELTPKCRK